MNRKQRFIFPLLLTSLCILLFFGTAAGLRAEEAVVLSSRVDKYKLGGFLYLFEDTTGSLEIDDILENEYFFIQAEEHEPNIGFTSSVYWVKLSVDNQDTSGIWLLEYAYSAMDLIEMFSVRNGQVTAKQVGGDSIPHAARLFPGRTFRFSLKSQSEGVTTYYLKFATSGAMVFPLTIWRENAFLQKNAASHIILGIFFGLMIVMMFYNFFLYLSTRDLSNLFYILFVAFHALFQACLLGIAQEYLWPGSIWWGNYALIFFAFLAISFSALFTREFLQIKKFLPRILFFFDLLMWIALAGSGLVLLIPYSQGVLIVNSLLVVLPGFFVVISILIYRKGYKPARFYIISWSLFCGAVIIVGLKNFGLLPSNTFTSHIMQIGSAVEVIFLSLAISDKISLLRLEKIRTEQELRVVQEKELRATEEKLYFDYLTSLPNRRKLLLDTNEMEEPTLFLINIDQFRQINDFYGNKIGDRILLDLKDRIQNFAEKNEKTLYKLHADEFALVREGSLSREECLDYGNNLYATCQEDFFEVDSYNIQLDVSIGIAAQTRNLLEFADMALSEARASNSHVKMYDPSMETRKQYESNLRWVGILRKAITEREVVPFFQPIVNNRTGKTEKYECLIRLKGEDGDYISPGQFLSIARASRLYPELSRIMIKKSFEAFSGSGMEFSLNLSIDDIVQEETLGLIDICLKEYPGSRVVFEILESEGIHSYDLASRFIDNMKNKGCKIAIDDFGSGYSSFEHILRLHVDYLKLDSSLIRNIDNDHQSYTVVETIHDFASKLNMETVAEFVHSESVHQTIKSIGINYSQGYHVGKPGPDIKSGPDLEPGASV